MATRTTKSAITKTKQKALDAYAAEIRGLIKQTLMSAVRIGEILKDVKENILPGSWHEWIDKEFPGDFHHDSCNNFINVYELYREYSESHEEGLKKLPLSSLYLIGRSSVEPEVRRTVLELAEEQEPLNRDEVRTVVQAYRKIKLSQAGLTEPAAVMLKNSEIAENAKEVKALSKLSKRKQEAVAELLGTGTVQTTREALREINGTLKDKEEEIAKEIAKVDVKYTQLKELSYHYLEEVADESVNLAIVEAPLKLAYVDQGLPNVAKELDRILAPGGYLIHFLGHKAIMYAGDALHPLVPLHVLCLRKQPGKSRFIVGSNITSASVLAVFAYKSPYVAPTKMLVDLQTIDLTDEEKVLEGIPLKGDKAELTDSEALEGLDVVDNGIERCLHRILGPLLEKGATVMHAVVEGSAQFGLEDQVHTSCLKYGAASLVKVRESHR